MPVASPGTTPALQFTIAGHISFSEGLQELVCSDGTHLRIFPQLQEYPSGQMLWHLLPSTDSTGVISSVKVVEIQSPTAIGNLHQDQCQVVGRVVQISKRQNRILLKVTRPDEKTLKLTMSHPDPRMEISELWSCTAIRVGSTLQIIEANPLEEIYQSPTTTPASQTPKVHSN